jgi:integrase
LDRKELTQFEARWPPGSRQRLAYALLLYTGQRGSDLHRMSYAHIDGDTIEVEQQKTGQEESDEKLVIPMHRNLRAELTQAKREHVAILTTVFGQPFSLKGFGNFMSDAIRAAGLPPRCKAHGLRKAAARRLAEAGCTAKQIQAITGHRSLKEVERYTRKADQTRLARQAVAMQENNGGS